MPTVASSPGNQSPSWIELPQSALKGEGLRPYHEGEITNLSDWVENMNGASRHLMPYRHQFIVDIVEIEDNAVHQPSKPGDEIVVVVNGILRLIDDSDKAEQVFHAGEMVLIPAGWAGIYRVTEHVGPFIELAIVPNDYFDEAAAVPPTGKAPLRLDPPRAPGRHELYRNRYVVEADNRDDPAEWSIDARSDEIIQVLSGALTLNTNDNACAFPSGSVVILPQGFKGNASTNGGYRAVHSRWLD